MCIPKAIQWEFQDPKLEVPTIYKAYIIGLCKGISPAKNNGFIKGFRDNQQALVTRRINQLWV